MALNVVGLGLQNHSSRIVQSPLISLLKKEFKNRASEKIYYVYATRWNEKGKNSIRKSGMYREVPLKKPTNALLKSEREFFILSYLFISTFDCSKLYYLLLVPCG